jgi:hypothetical protein
VSDGANAYFTTLDGIYQATEARAEALMLAPAPAGRLALDVSGYIYFERDGVELVDLWRVPLSGGDAELVIEDTPSHFQVAGDDLYAIEPTFGHPLTGDDGVYYVSRMPKDGGAAWTRLMRRSGTGGYRIQVSGEFVFHDNFPSPNTGDWELLQGRLDAVASSEPLLSLSLQAWYWIGTPAGVFWSHGTDIYLRENAQ